MRPPVVSITRSTTVTIGRGSEGRSVPFWKRGWLKARYVLPPLNCGPPNVGQRRQRRTSLDAVMGPEKRTPRRNPGPIWGLKNAIRSAIRAQSGAIRRNPAPKTQFSVPWAYPPLGFFFQKRNPPGPEPPYYITNGEKRTGGSRFGDAASPSQPSRILPGPRLLEFYHRHRF